MASTLDIDVVTYSIVNGIEVSRMYYIHIKRLKIGSCLYLNPTTIALDSVIS